MTRLGHVATLSFVLATGAGCELADRIDGGCPATVDEAAELEWGDAIVGGGGVIRFVPSPQLEFRGYDVNLTRPISERARLNTYFLRVREEIPGIAAGDPVLFIGARADRGSVLVPGVCPPLTVTTDEDAGMPASRPDVPHRPDS